MLAFLWSWSEKPTLILLSPILFPLSLLSYQLCVILEPMQELMSRHKTYSLSPRDCLKTCLFQKWQRMVAPPGKYLAGWVPDIGVESSVS